MYISAKIIADSINEYGHRLTTFRLTYPRIILSELNTFRIASKNTASSRAIPVKENIDRILNDPFIPDTWIKNSKGMYSFETLDSTKNTIKDIWLDSSISACEYAKKFVENDLHKQYANRIIEPYMYVDTILSGTDFDNFFHLRISYDAQPEIQRLAELMYEEYRKSIPNLLQENQWHLPYIDTTFDGSDDIQYSINGESLDLDTAIKISVSCCGQVSYRKLNTSIEKALEIYDKFVSGDKIHASALEHAAKPFSIKEYNFRERVMGLAKISLGNELSELDIDRFMYKRNFKGWTQYRTIISNETFTKKYQKV